MKDGLNFTDNLGLSNSHSREHRFPILSLFAFLGVFSLNISVLRGQSEIVVGSTNNLVSTAFDNKTRDLYAIWEDSVRVFLAPDYSKSRLIEFHKPTDFNFGEYNNVIANSSLYFIHTMGGLVYHLEQDTISRIDRSHNHRMQIMSSIMVKNDTIFRYGGYGFWSNRNFFTFFSNSSKEWEIVLPHGKQEVPEGVNAAGMTHDRENTYIYGGHYRLPYELYDQTFYNKAWQFNWPEHKWELLGSINQDFVLAESHIDMGSRDLYYLSRRLLVVVDPSRNKVSHFTLPDSRYDNACSDGQCQISNNLNWKIDGYYQDGNFFLPFFYPDSRQVPKSTGTLIYKIIPESEFLVTLVSEEPLYASAQSPISYAVGILLAMGAFGGSLLFYLRKKRQNKILVLEDGLMYRGQKTPLDPSSIALIKLLIASNGEAAAQKVLELVENPTLSEGHNLKLRTQLVDKINLRLRALLQTEKEMITVVRSSTDRRNKSFRLDVSQFKIQGQ